MDIVCAVYVVEVVNEDSPFVIENAVRHKKGSQEQPDVMICPIL